MPSHKSQQGSIVMILAIVGIIILLGVIGFLFWKNTYSNQPPGQANTADSENPTTYKTYTTDKYPISFDYPDAWTVAEPQFVDTSAAFFRTVDVKTKANNSIEFTVGQQGIGGTCGITNERTYTTLAAEPTELKGPRPITLSFTVMQNLDKTYQAFYGLTDTYVEVGEKSVCPNLFYYLFKPNNEAYYLMSFGGEKSFATLDEAKAFLASNEYKNIRAMILSLKY